MTPQVVQCVSFGVWALVLRVVQRVLSFGVWPLVLQVVCQLWCCAVLQLLWGLGSGARVAVVAHLVGTPRGGCAPCVGHSWGPQVSLTLHFLWGTVAQVCGLCFPCVCLQVVSLRVGWLCHSCCLLLAVGVGALLCGVWSKWLGVAGGVFEGGEHRATHWLTRRRGVGFGDSTSCF